MGPPSRLTGERVFLFSRSRTERNPGSYVLKSRGFLRYFCKLPTSLHYKVNPRGIVAQSAGRVKDVSRSEYKQVVRSLLIAENIQVNSLEWIAPTLEDVFISSVTAVN
jgi:hypothetical protein